MKSNPVIGIIGGTGTLGTIFKRFFEDWNYRVLISSRKTEMTSEELVKKSDVVIVSVPISKTAEIINSILPHLREDQLLMDFTSIKSISLNEMLK